MTKKGEKKSVEQSYDVAFTISPEGWKKVRKHWVLDVAKTVDVCRGTGGWQCWEWSCLGGPDLALLQQAVAELSLKEFRLISLKKDSLCQQPEKGETVGDGSGPFDLMLVPSGSDTRQGKDWIHVDASYAKTFFEQRKRVDS